MAQLRPVKIGIRQAGFVEIVNGLQPGERVVAEGLQKVRPGGKVKAAPDQGVTSETSKNDAGKLTEGDGKTPTPLAAGSTASSSR